MLQAAMLQFAMQPMLVKNTPETPYTPFAKLRLWIGYTLPGTMSDIALFARWWSQSASHQFPYVQLNTLP